MTRAEILDGIEYHKKQIRKGQLKREELFLEYEKNVKKIDADIEARLNRIDELFNYKLKDEN